MITLVRGDISNIISSLKHIEDSDRTSTFYNLKSGNKSIEKSRKVNYENNIEKKEEIAFSTFIVGVCVLIKIIMDVSVAGISGMGNINL